MKKVLIMLLIFSLFLSCEKDENKIDIQLLSGTWRMTEQYKDDSLLDCYSQIRNWTDISTGEISFTDTIKFGLATFYFSDYYDPSVYNTFILRSENVRDLFGRCELTNNVNEIWIQSIANEYMGEDTIINGNRYSFANFLNFEFKISELTDIRLILTKRDERLIFERNF